MRQVVLIVVALVVFALLVVAFATPVGGTGFWAEYWSTYTEYLDYGPVLVP